MKIWDAIVEEGTAARGMNYVGNCIPCRARHLVLQFFSADLKVSDIFAALPILVDAGYRVLIPYLRGFGETRFLSNAMPPNLNQPLLVSTP